MAHLFTQQMIKAEAIIWFNPSFQQPILLIANLEFLA